VVAARSFRKSDASRLFFKDRLEIWKVNTQQIDDIKNGVKAGKSLKPRWYPDMMARNPDAALITGSAPQCTYLFFGKGLLHLLFLYLSYNCYRQISFLQVYCPSEVPVYQ
jgi:hypothetical protein